MGISSGTGAVGFMPVGVVVPFAGSSSPAGWELCYGQAISRTTYAGLFATISTTYGSGDGSTTFNVPDLRGRSVAGVDNMGGTDAGRLSIANTLGTTTGTETHQHASSQMTAGANFFGAGANTYIDYAKRTGSTYTEDVRIFWSGVPTEATGRTETQTVGVGIFGDTDAASGMPPTIILNYIIKAA